MTRAEKLVITKQWADLKYREEKSVILSKQNIERKGKWSRWEK